MEERWATHVDVTIVGDEFDRDDGGRVPPQTEDQAVHIVGTQ